MKKLFVVIALLTCIETLYGQAFQVGLRTGAEYNLNTDYITYTEQTTWSKDIYARYETKKRFAIELNLCNNHYSYAIPADNSGAACWGFPSINGREYYGIIESNEVNMYSLKIIPQLRITQGDRRIADYLGLYADATIIYKQATYYNAFFDNREGFADKGSKAHYFDFRMGLSNSLFYKITPRLTLNNTFSFSLSPIVALSNVTYFLDTCPTISCSLGLGYFIN